MVAKQVKVIKEKAKALPTAEYVEVTPDMAEAWLETAHRNRSIKQMRVDRYAEMMRRGDWLMNGEGIKFNEQDRLLDGQHRLWAIVTADKPVRLLVVRNVNSRAQLVMDQGQKRMAHDQIRLREGFDVRAIHVAIAHSMIWSIGGPGTRKRREFANDLQLVDRFYLKHHKAIEFAVVKYGSHATVRGVTVAPVFAPIARAYYTQDQEALSRFADVVTTGMSAAPGELPAIVLRNYLIAGREKSLTARVGKDRYTIYKRTEIALNAFLKGESIVRLSQTSLHKELFPIPEDEKWDSADAVTEEA